MNKDAEVTHSNCKQCLPQSDIETVQGSSTWLNDVHMTAASKLLLSAHSHIGLQDTVLQQNNLWVVPATEIIQFIHVDNCHWITMSSVGDSTVNIYDSMMLTPSTETIRSICSYVHTSSEKIQLNVMNVDRQPDPHSCGLYSIAFATALADNHNPSHLTFKDLRQHFSCCLQNNSLSSVPANDSFRNPVILKHVDVRVYCDCHMPDDHKLMLKCDNCNAWYHAQCMGVSMKPRKSDTWICVVFRGRCRLPMYTSSLGWSLKWVMFTH